MNMHLQPPSGNNMNPAPFMFAPQEPEEVGFDFWGVLRRRKWLVFLGLLAGLVVGGIYNSQAQKIYESKATVTIQPRDKIIWSLSQGNQYDDLTKFDLRHDQLISENNILFKCLTEHGLSDLETLRDLPQEDQFKEIRENLVVIQNREEPTKYELEYTSVNPRDAQTILATVVSTYERYLNEQYQEVSQDTMELLNKMCDRLHRDIKNVDKLRERSRDTLKELAIDGKQEYIQQIVSDLRSKIGFEQSVLAELTQDLARSEAALESDLPGMMEHIWILEEQEKIRKGSMQFVDNSEQIGAETRIIEGLELQRDQLIVTQKIGPGHSQIQALNLAINDRKARVRELESQGSRIAGLGPEQIIQRFIVAVKQQIGDTRLALDSNLADYSKNSKKAVLSEQALLEAAELKEIRDKLVKKSDAADLQVMQETSSWQTNLHKGFRFNTTRRADRGLEIWPLLTVILPVGALLGSLFGFGLGCLVELADKTFHNPDEITRWLQVPLIGHVPVITQGKRYLVENSLIEPIVCTYHRPKSQVSEAFRAVRTALYFNTQGKQNSVIQVTSPTPGDGKSTLASNLAVSIAQSGKRVLLVDADMRRPRQHATFGISSRVGFATVLSGQSQWRDCMFECEEIEGLTVMPCGAKPQNPAELSSSPQVKILIEEMREEFDFVIIDTPPMLAVTDPSPIAARVDGIVLCMRIKKNVRVSAERAMQMINNLGANCIGLVVNGVGAQSGYGSQYTYGAYRAGYSYNGYGYGYGYGAGGSKYYDEDQRGRQARRSETGAQEPVLIESDKG